MTANHEMPIQVSYVCTPQIRAGTGFAEARAALTAALQETSE